MMLPIIAEHGAVAGTALVYENGLPETVEERINVARRTSMPRKITASPTRTSSSTPSVYPRRSIPTRCVSRYRRSRRSTESSACPRPGYQ